MQFTDVRVRKVSGKDETKLRANCSVTIDGAFVVHDLRVIEGAHGLFVSMPRKKTGENEFKDVAHPITAEAREQLQLAVLTAYEAALKKEKVETTEALESLETPQPMEAEASEAPL